MGTTAVSMLSFQEWADSQLRLGILANIFWKVDSLKETGSTGSNQDALETH